MRWLDTPHLPHGWECGYLMELATRTLLCGDLFTQGGADGPPVVSGDILGPSEAFRGALDYYSHTTKARAMVARLAGSGRRRWRACTAARGTATGRGCCARSASRSRRRAVLASC